MAIRWQAHSHHTWRRVRARLSLAAVPTERGEFCHTDVMRWDVQIVILGDEHNVEHIARHGVSPSEVEQVVASEKARRGWTARCEPAGSWSSGQSRPVACWWSCWTARRRAAWLIA